MSPNLQINMIFYYLASTYSSSTYVRTYLEFAVRWTASVQEYKRTNVQIASTIVAIYSDILTILYLYLLVQVV